jgi:hypothetical protein
MHAREVDSERSDNSSTINDFDDATASLPGRHRRCAVGTMVGRGSAGKRGALRWLQALGAPEVVLAPAAHGLRPYRLAVPNNQADRHIAAIKKGARLDRLLAGDKELKAVWPWIVGRTPLISDLLT